MNPNSSPLRSKPSETPFAGGLAGGLAAKAGAADDFTAGAAVAWRAACSKGRFKMAVQAQFPLRSLLKAAAARSQPSLPASFSSWTRYVSDWLVQLRYSHG